MTLGYAVTVSPLAVSGLLDEGRSQNPMLFFLPWGHTELCLTELCLLLHPGILRPQHSTLDLFRSPPSPLVITVL